MKEETSPWPSSASRSALAGWASTAGREVGRPTGLPASRRASTRRGSISKPQLARARRPSARRAARGRRARRAAARCRTRVAVVDAVAEDVEVLVGAVDRRDLGRGDDRTPCSRAGGERLVDAVDGVVVGQRQQLDAGGGGVGDDLGGRQLAVGVDGMGLEVERRCGHGRRQYRPSFGLGRLCRFAPAGRLVCASADGPPTPLDTPARAADRRGRRTRARPRRLRRRPRAARQREGRAERPADRHRHHARDYIGAYNPRRARPERRTSTRSPRARCCSSTPSPRRCRPASCAARSSPACAASHSATGCCRRRCRPRSAGRDLAAPADADRGDRRPA